MSNCARCSQRLMPESDDMVSGICLRCKAATGREYGESAGMVLKMIAGGHTVTKTKKGYSVTKSPGVEDDEPSWRMCKGCSTAKEDVGIEVDGRFFCDVCAGEMQGQADD